jgi:hypothetical protein
MTARARVQHDDASIAVARAGRIGRTLLTVAALCTCSNGVPVPTEQASPLVVIAPPNEQRVQFAGAVRSYAEQVDLQREVGLDDPNYVGIQEALRALSDAIVLIPRSADALIARLPADRMRDDIVRVGAGVLDDAGRTAAAKHALTVAAGALDQIAREAYPNVPTLRPLLSDLEESIASIDESRLLRTQRLPVVQSFENVLLILRSLPS